MALDEKQKASPLLNETNAWWTHGRLITLMVLIVGPGLLTLALGGYWWACHDIYNEMAWCGTVQDHPPWTPLAALVTAPALILTWWWREEHKRQTEADTAKQLAIAKSGQITERFSRAIEQLGSSALPVRLGGIYSLARIAKDSEPDHPTIIETLAGYIRENSGPVPAKLVPGKSPRIRPAIDIQAAADVIAKPTVSPQVHSYGVNLSGAFFEGADLKRAFLAGAHLDEAALSTASLERANLEHAHLEEAVLFEAKLWKVNARGAWFNGATLTGAHLHSANLKDAKLPKADLETASFVEADLSGANLVEAKLERANLTDADLSGARLDKANLQWAHLERASLHGAHLEGADLTDAQALTRDQLSSTIRDKHTKLPTEFADMIPKP